MYFGYLEINTVDSLGRNSLLAFCLYKYFSWQAFIFFFSNSLPSFAPKRDLSHSVNYFLFPEEYLKKKVCCWCLVSYQVFVWRSGDITKGKNRVTRTRRRFLGTGDGGGEACSQRRVAEKSKGRD